MFNCFLPLNKTLKQEIKLDTEKIVPQSAGLARKARQSRLAQKLKRESLARSARYYHLALSSALLRRTRINRT